MRTSPHFQSVRIQNPEQSCFNKRETTFRNALCLELNVYWRSFENHIRLSFYKLKTAPGTWKLTGYSLFFKQQPSLTLLGEMHTSSRRHSAANFSKQKEFLGPVSLQPHPYLCNETLSGSYSCWLLNIPEVWRTVGTHYSDGHCLASMFHWKPSFCSLLSPWPWAHSP